MLLFSSWLTCFLEEGEFSKCFLGIAALGSFCESESLIRALLLLFYSRKTSKGEFHPCIRLRQPESAPKRANFKKGDSVNSVTEAKKEVPTKKASFFQGFALTFSTSQDIRPIRGRGWLRRNSLKEDSSKLNRPIPTPDLLTDSYAAKATHEIGQRGNCRSISAGRTPFIKLQVRLRFSQASTFMLASKESAARGPILERTRRANSDSGDTSDFLAAGTHVETF